MHLYILQPRQGCWDPWYNTVGGMVVCAASEEAARALAATEAGNEGSDVWLDAAVTSCEELESAREGVILRSYNKA